jgi:RNA polymerase sigma-70 factor (ECF subfamily)
MPQFNELLEREIPRLRRYAHALMRSATESDDLVQETLVRALSKSHLWQAGTDLRAWLFTIMHNSRVNGVRRAVRTGISVSDDELERIGVSGGQHERISLIEVQAAIDRLPEEQRATVLLIGLEGRDYEEAAAVLGIPLGTVRSRLSRARAQLREWLDEPARIPAAAAVYAMAKREGTGRSIAH